MCASSSTQNKAFFIGGLFQVIAGGNDATPSVVTNIDILQFNNTIISNIVIINDGPLIIQGNLIINIRVK